MIKPIIDIHCHPTMKPYGHSFDNCLASSDYNNMACPWHDTPVKFTDQLANELLGVTPFRQSDFNTLNKGNSKIICTSIYPVEKRFTIDRFGDRTAPGWLLNYTIGLGENRINNIRSHKDYFTDLVKEYNYLTSMNKQTVLINGIPHSYFLVNQYTEIEKFINSTAENTILSIVTIEGGHVFNSGISPEPETHVNTDSNKVLENVITVKNWEYRPLFITLAHHFYNELCGHSKSLSEKMLERFGIRQQFMINTGFTDLGLKVVDALLDNTDGKRIYIDIKHMSRASRITYLNDILKSAKYINEDIPIVVSHGGVTGLINEKGGETIRGASSYFLTDDINLYDDELIAIARSKGIFGIQLDQRRLASDSSLNTLLTMEDGAVADDWAILVWRQIQHIAQVLDNVGLNAWTLATLGSDYDGVINPPPVFLTAEELPALEKGILNCAKKYITNNDLKEPFNTNISAEEITNNFFRDNALRFFKNYLK